MARLVLLGALLVLLAACGGDGEEDGGAAGPVDVELVVVTGVATSEQFEVRCDPSGGTTRDPGATCAAIAEHPEMLNPPPLESSCPGNLGNPPEVRVGGTANDEPEERAEAARRWLEAAGLSSG